MKKYIDGITYLGDNGSWHDTDQGNGYYMSFKNDRLHAIGQPALINKEGKFWMVHGKLHREDGPAIENIDGYKEYWVNGKQLTEEEFTKKYLSKDNLKTKNRIK